MESSSPIINTPATFSVVIEARPTNNQPIANPSFDVYNGVPAQLEEINTSPESFTTIPPSVPSEPATPIPPISVSEDAIAPPSRPSKRRKVVTPRDVTSEIPHPLTEPYAVQANCRSIQRKKRKDFPMCMSCATHSFSSGCKFASIRAFPIDPETKQYTSFTNGMFLNSAPFLGQNQREATRTTTINYSIPGTSSDVEFIKSCIAPTLTSVLAMELVHEVIFRDEGLLRRRREAGIRPLCDSCATTIFSGHFMCCSCGREICLDCYSEWDDSEAFGQENVDSCLKRRRHTKRQMMPFSLFEEGELERLIKDIKTFPMGKSDAVFQKKFLRDHSEGYLPYTKCSVDDITGEDFKFLWGLGQPLVLTGCLGRFQIPWTPDYLIQNYGNEKCLLVDCNTDKMITGTVGNFFDEFLSTEPTRSLKLKDWPPANDFAEIFPELFADFENALPFPAFTRRKGFVNLASRFPEDLVAPDLGPKMYNAYASDDGINGQGTTKLHLDITDAVNIMAFASPNETSTARGGAAVWDIFPADATDTIRQFLRESTNYGIDDPVLRQTSYISTPSLQKLREQYHIIPWRIYQNPGEAIFIPAGCAHQVCNLTSCIKVACDFVSPHCIRRCRELIDGTRRLAAVRGGKREDVLQLKTMMMCAWEEMGRWQEHQQNIDTALDDEDKKDISV